MTDAKELAARLRELANNEAYRSREHELDAAHSIMEAAAALEAQAEEIAVKAGEAQAYIEACAMLVVRIAALEQAAAGGGE